jgi:hypothetical protein
MFPQKVNTDPMSNPTTSQTAVRFVRILRILRFLRRSSTKKFQKRKNQAFLQAST